MAATGPGSGLASFGRCQLALEVSRSCRSSQTARAARMASGCIAWESWGPSPCCQLLLHHQHQPERGQGRRGGPARASMPRRAQHPFQARPSPHPPAGACIHCGKSPLWVPACCCVRGAAQWRRRWRAAGERGDATTSRACGAPHCCFLASPTPSNPLQVPHGQQQHDL